MGPRAAIAAATSSLRTRRGSLVTGMLSRKPSSTRSVNHDVTEPHLLSQIQAHADHGTAWIHELGGPAKRGRKLVVGRQRLGGRVVQDVQHVEDQIHLPRA